MRIFHTVHFFASEDAAGDKGLVGNADASKRLQKIDSMQRAVGGNFTIAALQTENLSFGDVAAVKGIYICADNDMNIIFNNGTDILQIRRADTTTGRKATLFIEGNFTEVEITNPSATLAVSGIFAVWGDPSS